jgi:hypothetical protein
MAADYLLLEDGSKLILEDSSGDLILESSTDDTRYVNRQIMSGVG